MVLQAADNWEELDKEVEQPAAAATADDKVAVSSPAKAKVAAPAAAHQNEDKVDSSDEDEDEVCWSDSLHTA